MSSFVIVPCAIRIADRRATRVAQLDRERFVRSNCGVAVDQHRDGLGRLVRREVQRVGIRLIIAVGHSRRSVLRLEVNRRTQLRAAGLGHSEDIGGRA